MASEPASREVLPWMACEAFGPAQVKALFDDDGPVARCLLEDVSEDTRQFFCFMRCEQLGADPAAPWRTLRQLNVAGQAAQRDAGINDLVRRALDSRDTERRRVRSAALYELRYRDYDRYVATCAALAAVPQRRARADCKPWHELGERRQQEILSALGWAGKHGGTRDGAGRKQSSAVEQAGP